MYDWTIRKNDTCFFFKRFASKQLTNHCKELWTSFFHDPMQVMLKWLSDSVLFGFSVFVCGNTLICHPAIISNCCDILEEKDLSGLRQGGTTYQCIPCLKTKRDISKLKIDSRHREKKSKLNDNIYINNYEMLRKEAETRSAVIARQRLGSFAFVFFEQRKRCAFIVGSHQ